MLEIKVKKLIPEAVIPTYAHAGDAGMDVTCTSYEYDNKNDCFMYHTGLAFELPVGYVMLIFPRSSNRKTDYYLCNHVGVLDSGYRGELMFAYKRRDDSKYNFQKQPYNVGDRISSAVYETLSEADKAKCASAIIQLTFDPHKLRLDMTNYYYQNKIAETKEVIDGFDYVNSFTFVVKPQTSIAIKFYKLDTSKDYTYPITNSNPIVAINAS